MIMAAVRGDSELDRHFAEKGRIGQSDARLVEIIGYGEAERVAPRGERARRQIGAAAVGVRGAPPGFPAGPAQRHCEARGGPAVHRVEHMGAERIHGVCSSLSRTISPISSSALAISVSRSLARRRSIAARSPALWVSRTQMMKRKPNFSR